jgi:integrase
LQNLLAMPTKIAKVEHHAALPYRELGAFMADLAQMPGIGARALEFAILTAARSGEVRGATWAEIDMDLPRYGHSRRAHEGEERARRTAFRRGAGSAAACHARADLVFPGARLAGRCPT